jgi:hypothetical protein
MVLGFHGWISLTLVFIIQSLSVFSCYVVFFCFRFWAPSHSEINRMNFAASLCICWHHSPYWQWPWCVFAKPLYGISNCYGHGLVPYHLFYWPKRNRENIWTVNQDLVGLIFLACCVFHSKKSQIWLCFVTCIDHGY